MATRPSIWLYLIYHYQELDSDGHQAINMAVFDLSLSGATSTINMAVFHYQELGNDGHQAINMAVYHYQELDNDGQPTIVRLGAHAGPGCVARLGGAASSESRLPVRRETRQSGFGAWRAEGVGFGDRGI